jgi:hypothetical protein
MKRVSALCLVCVVVFAAQGCSAQKTQLSHSGGQVYRQTLPQHSTHTRPRNLESERIRIERMKAVTETLWAAVAVARVTCEILRVIR